MRCATVVRCKHFMDFYFRAQLQKNPTPKASFRNGSGIDLGFYIFYFIVFFVFGLGGFARVLFPQRTFPWFFLVKTLFSLHLGRMLCHFLSVFIGKTHVTLSFVEKKTVFLTFWTDFVPFRYVFVRKTYATLVGVAVVVVVVVVAVIVAVGAVVVIVIVLVNVIIIAVLVVAVVVFCCCCDCCDCYYHCCRCGCVTIPVNVIVAVLAVLYFNMVRYDSK